MIPVDPPETENWDRIVWSGKQDVYEPLVALVDEYRTKTKHYWTFTLEERLAIASGADLAVTVLYYGQPLQPIMFEVV